MSHKNARRLVCFIMLLVYRVGGLEWWYLFIHVRVISLALGQYCDRPIASAVIMEDKGKRDWHEI